MKKAILKISKLGELSPAWGVFVLFFSSITVERFTTGEHKIWLFSSISASRPSIWGDTIQNFLDGLFLFLIFFWAVGWILHEILTRGLYPFVLVPMFSLLAWMFFYGDMETAAKIILYPVYMLCSFLIWHRRFLARGEPSDFVLFARDIVVLLVIFLAALFNHPEIFDFNFID